MPLETVDGGCWTLRDGVTAPQHPGSPAKAEALEGAAGPGGGGGGVEGRGPASATAPNDGGCSTGPEWRWPVSRRAAVLGVVVCVAATTFGGRPPWATATNRIFKPPPGECEK